MPKVIQFFSIIIPVYYSFWRKAGTEDPKINILKGIEQSIDITTVKHDIL
jgi:hypothetical protein